MPKTVRREPAKSSPDVRVKAVAASTSRSVRTTAIEPALLPRPRPPEAPPRRVSAGDATLPQLPGATLERARWSDLNGWKNDDHAAAYSVFHDSCSAVIAAANADAAKGPLSPTSEGLVGVCRKALDQGPLEANAARAFFETNFSPVRIKPTQGTDPKLTGYYVPVFETSSTRDDAAGFTSPIYARPDDLVDVGDDPALKEIARGLGNPELTALRKKPGGGYEAYPTRTEIETQGLPGTRVLAWAKDPVDSFFAQIQGGALISVDGEPMKLQYDGRNGQPYTPVGRALISSGEVPREQMSMQRIREWMTANPDRAVDLRRQNASFVFFKMARSTPDDQGEGSQGLSLTPQRSIAIDPKLYRYGTPFYIEAELPIDGEHARTPFQRTMIAQDSGSAITGPVRADLYWGVGTDAGLVAGRFKHAPTSFTMLLPNSR